MTYTETSTQSQKKKKRYIADGKARTCLYVVLTTALCPLVLMDILSTRNSLCRFSCGGRKRGGGLVCYVLLSLCLAACFLPIYPISFCSPAEAILCCSVGVVKYSTRSQMLFLPQLSLNAHVLRVRTFLVWWSRKKCKWSQKELRKGSWVG